VTNTWPALAPATTTETTEIVSPVSGARLSRSWAELYRPTNKRTCGEPPPPTIEDFERADDGHDRDDVECDA